MNQTRPKGASRRFVNRSRRVEQHIAGPQHDPSAVVCFIIQFSGKTDDEFAIAASAIVRMFAQTSALKQNKAPNVSGIWI
jgi:hypothetical protein